MPDISLKAKSPLDGFVRDFAGISVWEVTGRAIVSASVPHGGEAALNGKLQDGYAVDIPAVGESLHSQTDNACLMGVTRDQFFILFDEMGEVPLVRVRDRLGEAAYLTDQSDSWVLLSVSGPQARAALERICMLDLNPGRFQPGQVARTSMEHMGVIILCEDRDTYLLLSLRSSAKSFLHAVIKSAESI